jgi:hypothetical protein
VFSAHVDSNEVGNVQCVCTGADTVSTFACSRLFILISTRQHCICMRASSSNGIQWYQLSAAALTAVAVEVAVVSAAVDVTACIA